MNQRNLNEIKNNSIFENTMEMYSLYEYKFQKGKIELKQFYVKNRDEFLRKLRIKYPNADEFHMHL